VDRLGQVVAGAEAQRLEHVLLVGVGGEDDDAQLGALLAQAPEHLQPVQVGKLDVEDHHADLRILGGGQRLGAAGGGGVRDARLVEGLPDHLAEEALVVHDQDARGLLRHGSPIGRSAYKM
jgi:hypothetical protein